MTSEDDVPDVPPTDGAVPGDEPAGNGQRVAAKLVARPVVQELKTSFLDYAMSVIVSRALPDVRDGLKPVHRRVLYAMNELGVRSDKPRRKSALIVGEVMGKYHPHGDLAIYDTLVRMAQPFSLRHTLVDGQGNFGSVDGDGAAAMRYTEARLAAVAQELLADLDKETVDFVPNYDASLEEPTVLPSRFPNLLVNGSDGIAVGMATKMAPHNLGEVIDATMHLIDNPDAGVAELMQFLKGPDFPTGGIIMGQNGIVNAYATGRGRVVVRARVSRETLRKDRQALIVTELPYQVNKANLLITIADLVKEKRIEGISDLRDESDRDGMRVVIELRRDADADVVVNQLFTHTQLQNTFGVVNIALVKGRPVQLTLPRLLQEFLAHRVEVVTRRTKYELRKAEERAHVLEGLLIALDNVDEVVQLIRASKDSPEAQRKLIARFGLTEVQAKAILDMRLSRLAALEAEEVRTEHGELLKRIAEYKRILGSPDAIFDVIKAELQAVREKYADDRRTEISSDEAEELDLEALIAEHKVAVTLTKAGYVKRIPLDEYRRQGRGGKGIIGAQTKEEDTVVDLFVTSTHDYLLFFTTKGRVFRLKGYEIPEAGRYSRGKAIVNLLPALESGERVSVAIPVHQFVDDQFIFFVTRRGTVKRCNLSLFRNVLRSGIRAITLDEGDEVFDVALTTGGEHILLASKRGKACRFEETQVRAMGRTAAGVRGIRLGKDDEVVGLGHVITEGAFVLSVKANGRGKRTPLEDYPVKNRGIQGVIGILTDESPMVGMAYVHEGDDLIVTTRRGKVIRVHVTDVPVKGRMAQGNWIMRAGDDDEVVAITRLKKEVEEEAEGAAVSESAAPAA